MLKPSAPTTPLTCSLPVVGLVPVSYTHLDVYKRQPYTFTVSPTTATTYTLTAVSDANCNAVAANITGSACLLYTSLLDYGYNHRYIYYF